MVILLCSILCLSFICLIALLRALCLLRCKKLEIPSNANPIIFEAIVPSTADKNLFFLLGSLWVGKIKLNFILQYVISGLVIILYLFLVQSNIGHYSSTMFQIFLYKGPVRH